MEGNKRMRRRGWKRRKKRREVCGLRLNLMMESEIPLSSMTPRECLAQFPKMKVHPAKKFIKTLKGSPQNSESKQFRSFRKSLKINKTTRPLFQAYKISEDCWENFKQIELPWEIQTRWAAWNCSDQLSYLEEILFQPIELPRRVGVPECAIQGSEPLENKRTKTWCILTLSAWIRLRAV